MTVGDIIRPGDVPEAIATAIDTATSGYSGSYAGYSTTVNAIKDIANRYTNTYKENNDTKEKGAFPGRLIKPYAVLNLIYKSMRETCRCGTITYEKYSNTGYANIKNYTPKRTSYSVKILFSELNPGTPSSADAFCAKVATTKKPNVSNNGTLTTIDAQANGLKGTPIRVIDITDLLNKCNAICRSITQTKNLGCLNSCYSSCHTNCHGSSRSRR